jgi:transposase
MTLIAFDVGKRELVGVRVNAQAAVKASYAIPNDSASIAVFLDAVHAKHPRLVVASEATAEYHRPLAQACLTRDIPFRLVNPLVTKQLTRVTIRKQKTDATDALLIAKAVLQGAGTLLTAESLAPGKVLNRMAVKLAGIAGQLLRMERHIEETSASPNVHALLLLLHKQVGDAVCEVQRVAASSLDPKLCALVQSIPGVGPTLATAFLTELMPLERFPTQKAIVAYAGLDPRVKQSGMSLKRNTHLTKRGSPVLRRCAYLAASIAQRHDPELKAYFEKKRAEGKRYREATIANARHMLARVAAVWRRGTPYVKRDAAAPLSTAQT